ncbi:GNAT family N-acetyltransferase [Roseobacter sp. HKCCA0434]|uniref:GNAT family N-acetyltransferase n=1 Tax=Roseobacter sp. HKCCA0434 TaxID=3079297 RepID=UPI0029058E02|nr:GNAT family N-acetyltransferase [Roseobacter sp. HKCCA0434]
MIRPATPNDLAEATRISHAAYDRYVAELGEDLPPRVQDFAPEIEAAHLWVCDGGLICARPHDGDWLIENVAVEPARQREGIGRNLIAAMEAEGRRRDFTRVVLYTNERMVENLALYPRLGYAETHRAVEDGRPRVWFAKDL